MVIANIPTGRVHQPSVGSVRRKDIRTKALHPPGGVSSLAGESVGYAAVTTQKCVWERINWHDDYIGEKIIQNIFSKMFKK